MKITKISPQKKRNNRFNIFVDNDYSFSLNADQLLEAKIARGDEIFEKEVGSLRRLSAEGLLLENAYFYLSSRPHSIKETQTYIKQKIHKKEELKSLPRDQKEIVIEKVINVLLNKNYLNDNEFAVWFINQRLKARNPKGKKLIESELFAKGVSREIVSNIFLEIGETQELDNIEESAQKKYSQLIKRQKNPKETKQKLITYLLSRGYDWEDVHNTVDSILTHKYNRH